MSDELVEQLLKSLTPEQKSALVQGLMSETKQEVKPEYKRNPPKQHQNHDDIFVMKEKPKTARRPVTEGKRYNKFKDTGTDHKDETHATPNVELTERRRPSFKKVAQTCSRCNKSTEVHPQHARDFFVCDSCLRR